MVEEEEDRISQLPEHILQNHILSLLPQNDAVQTCVLSKSWRHLGPTRPKIEFHESSFRASKNQEEFLSVVENTLRRYADQNLSIQEFILEMFDSVDSQSIPLLEEWIPKVLMNKGLKTFNLSARDFSLPPLNIFFESEFLEELFLKGCKLDHKNFNFNSTGALSRLRKLSLVSVCIKKENFEKIMSMCPLIQHLVLVSCTHHVLSEYNEWWFHLRSNYFFPRLKSLHLQDVHLPREWLNNLSSSNNNCLRTLTLRRVRIEKETFEKIMSVCPLVEHLVLSYCRGLRTIKLKMAPNLKHLGCHVFSETGNGGSIEIIDAPSLQTLRIIDCKNWYLNKNNYFFPRLKSLFLWNVRLPTELLNNLSSNNCPCLQDFELRYCSGFTEFELSNRSIKRLIIYTPNHPIKAVNIDAANMLHFEFVSGYLPSIISFATTSNDQCKSRVYVPSSSSFFDADAVSAWYLKLHEFLLALSQSQISLIINYLPVLTNQDTCEPVVVESLCLALECYSSGIPDLLNCVFRICRPRYIGMPLYGKTQEICAEPIWKALVEKVETKIWQQDLEESSIQLSDKNTDEEWRSVQVCEFSNKENIRFRLKWRDLS